MLIPSVRRPLYVALLVLLAAAGLFVSVDAAAPGRIIDVSPQSVTIHPHSAIARARVSLELSSGHHVIGLRNLTREGGANQSTEEASLSVSPSEGSQCVVERLSWTTQELGRNDTLIVAKREEAKLLEISIRNHNAKTDILKDTLRLTQQLEVQPRGGNAAVQPPVSVEAAMSSLDSILTRRMDLLDQIHSRDNEWAAMQARLAHLRKEEAAAYSNSERVALVYLHVPEGAGAVVDMDVSYIISGVRWSPHYTIRQDSAAGKMSVSYQAIVRQDSLSDWEDVLVELATGSPSADRVVPSLTPISIYLGAPPSIPTAQRGGGARHMRKAKQAIPTRTRSFVSTESGQMEGEPEMAAYGFDSMADLDDVSMGVDGIAKVDVSEVSSVGITELFVLKGRHTIPGGQDTRLTITDLMLDSDIVYTAVPKMSTKVFVEGRVHNLSPYTLLPGPSVIYMDSTLAGTGSLPLVGVNGNTTVSLGVDSSMVVMKKLVSKTNERSSWLLRTATRSHRLHYSLVVSSRKKMGVSVRVLDQVPLSTSPDIQVTLLQPLGGVLPVPMTDAVVLKEAGSSGGDGDGVTLKDTSIDHHGQISWERFVGAGQTVTIPFEFALVYPDGGYVEGFDEVN